jgi:hypothetical protein
MSVASVLPECVARQAKNCTTRSIGQQNQLRLWIRLPAKSKDTPTGLGAALLVVKVCGGDVQVLQQRQPQRLRKL